MGFKHSINVTHRTMKAIAVRCLRTLRHTFVSVYIDNVIFYGTDKSELESVRARFIAECRRLDLTLGEIGDLSKLVTFRGIQFDLTNNTIAIADKFVTKFSSRLSLFKRNWADIRALISSTLYGMSILNIPYSRAFRLLKFMARHARHAPKSHVTWWRHAEREFFELSKLIIANKPVTPIDPSQQICVITDATLELGAFVIVTPSGRLITGTCNVTGSDINVCEAQALHAAMNHPLAQYRIINYFGDNTAVLSTINSTHSKSFELNMWIGRILGRLNVIKSRLIGTYVPSKLNPADSLSRGRKFSAVDRVLSLLLANSCAV